MPEPVPPQMKILYFAFTSNFSTSAICGVIEPYCMSRSTVIGSFENFLMVTIGPFNEIGRSTTLTREPSRSLVSTIGLAWFTSLPAKATIRCTISSRFSSLSNRSSILISFPDFSIKISFGPLIMTSVTVLSLIIVSKSPNPRMALKI